MKNKKLLIVTVLLVLITSFLLFILKPNTKNKKLKELNYNVTYKEAFPDQNLRRGVLLCIMRNKCGEEQYNSGAYDYNIYKEHMEDANYIKKYYETKDYQKNPDFGAIITEEQLEQKEEEKISKEDLDKLRVLIPYEYKNGVYTLEGVEYLSNLKAALSGNLYPDNDNIDFSYNKNLEVIYFNQSDTISQTITNITFPQNNKIKHIIGKRYAGNLDLSDFKFLETFEMIDSQIHNIILPESIKTLNLKDNPIERIDLTSLLKLKTVILSISYLKNTINFTNNPNLETVELFGNPLSVKLNKQIDFSHNINLKTLVIKENDLESLNLENNVKLEILELSENKITKLDISKNLNLKNLYINKSKLESLNLENNIKLENLDVSDNKYLKNLDIRNLKKLKHINLNDTIIRKDSIDFSNNPDLETAYITGDAIKIDSLDFSNSPDLKKLHLNANLKKLNIENSPNIKSLELSNNNITDLKVPTNLWGSLNQTIYLKVKKDTDVEIPVYLNNEKLYSPASMFFTRQGDKYRFDTVGNFYLLISKTINKFSYYLYINIEVTEDDVDFVPLISNQKQENYTPLINEEIKTDDIKRIIKNLPNDIKNFEIVSPNPVKFKEKGKNTLKIKIVFNDNKTKTFDISIDVYEPEYNYFIFNREFNFNIGYDPYLAIRPEERYYIPCTVNLVKEKNIEYIRKRNLQKKSCPCDGSVDYANFIKYEDVKPISYEYIDLPKGLNGDFDGISGKIDYEFKEGEKEHIFYIKYKEIGHVYNLEENIKIKLLRDIDSDGIPDIYDDDADGDGFSDLDELKVGSNQYDKNSTPNNIVNVSKDTEASKFNPIIDQKDYKPLFYQLIPKEKVKKIITNLPVDIKNFEILRIFHSNTGEYTKIKVAVSITFKDNSKKEFDIPINAYKEKFLTPRLKIKNKTILEGKKLDIDILKNYAEEEHIDDNNFIKYIKDKIINYSYRSYGGFPKGLIYNLNSVTGIIDYNFTEDNEEKRFEITYEEKYNHIFTLSPYVFITLLRDTDKDGIPDKDDDDKDGDGVSNDIEIANGSDQYNKNIIPGMSKKEVLDVLVNDLEKLINDNENNSFESKNKLDVDTFKKEKLHTAKEKLKEVKKSYNETTSDIELEKLQEQVKEVIYNIKDSLNNINDKANFEELDKELLNVLEKEDYYNEEIFKEYLKLIKEAKNLSRDTARQYEVYTLWKDLVDKRESLKLDKTKFLNQIEEINEKLSNVKCTDNECSYIKEKILELYNGSLSCEYLTIEEIIEIINKSNKLLKNYKFTNPNTGIKTYSLIMVFIILVSYLVFKKNKNYVR